jgi:hypothetical protein
MKMIHRGHVHTALLGLGLLAGGPAWSAEPMADIKACAAVRDADSRLACFDELAERVQYEELAADSASAVVAEESGEESGEASLPKHLGGAEFEEQSDDFETHHQGTITECQQGRDGRWYFVFSNGQVWRQSNLDRLRFKECNFLATISRDGFGYKMLIDVKGKQKQVRVSRVK